MKDLGDFVLIAGANGCGKTTVLDALRLVKSLYVKDEWQRWFGEMAVNLQRPSELRTVFRRADKPARIAASVEVGEEELRFVADHSINIFQTILMNERGESAQPVTGEAPLLPPSLDPAELTRVKERADELAADLMREIEASGGAIAVDVSLQADPPRIDPLQSLLATVFFACFRPDVLGELEFQTSRRIYVRENVGSVNLRIADRAEQRRSRLLYDVENRYRDIKSQLLEEYVAAMLRREKPEEGPLQASLRELFDTFFPGKQFKGIQVAEDGSISFPVELTTGEMHDIDELSSGEKEIVYGYLGLRTATPIRSVILIDEPELHLNPALVQGLPDFYERNLARALDAQVWIVTHSDAILRQGVRSPNMSVYHMARPQGDGGNQVLRIDSQDAVESAVIDLVGNLAAYRPHAKIVLVEGSGPTAFDVDVIKRLFPELTERANFIASGSRSETVRIAARLQEVVKGAGLAGRVVTITDRDLVRRHKDSSVRTWPVYEIENFLLEPPLLRATLVALLRHDPVGSDEQTLRALRDAADGLVERLALVEVQELMNEEFRQSMDIGGSPGTAAQDLTSSSTSSQARVAAIDVSEARVAGLLDQARERLRDAIQADSFLSDFPGERLLLAFAGSFGLDGEIFRNACLDQAQHMRLRPTELERVLTETLES